MRSWRAQQQCKRRFKHRPLVESLRDSHEVSIASFDIQTRTLTVLSRLSAEPGEEESTTVELNWQEELHARGQETRLGNALLNALKTQDEGPLAGVIVISDGGNNSGTEPLELADRAAAEQLPIFTVGVGSTDPRRNLRVQQFTVPARVYPDDRTTVRGLIHGEGFAGRTIDVELYARSSEAPEASAARIDRQPITFLTDPELVPVEFDIEPTELGRMLLDLRVVAPTDDQYAQGQSPRGGIGGGGSGNEGDAHGQRSVARLSLSAKSTAARLPFDGRRPAAIGTAGDFAGRRQAALRFPCDERRPLRIRLHRGPSIPIGLSWMRCRLICWSRGWLKRQVG